MNKNSIEFEWYHFPYVDATDEYTWLHQIIHYMEDVKAPFIYELLTKKEFNKWLKYIIEQVKETLKEEDELYLKGIQTTLKEKGFEYAEPLKVLDLFEECVNKDCVDKDHWTKQTEFLIELHTGDKLDLSYESFDKKRKKHLENLKKENK